MLSRFLHLYLLYLANLTCITERMAIKLWGHLLKCEIGVSAIYRGIILWYKIFIIVPTNATYT